MAQAADLLKPLYDLMAERVRASKVIWTDDTPVPVRDPTLPRTRTGRSWVYVGDDRLPGGGVTPDRQPARAGSAVRGGGEARTSKEPG